MRLYTRHLLNQGARMPTVALSVMSALTSSILRIQSRLLLAGDPWCSHIKRLVSFRYSLLLAQEWSPFSIT
ncbi:hypothetical protein M752DRAFT_83794 [Aspergillus phoenicis ATCC 13157]|nr:hypothetical protein M752DRAFT_83794 [Aspergillus phoenicis ATCC 13157]